MATQAPAHQPFLFPFPALPGYAVSVHARDSRTLWCNAVHASLFGMTPEDMAGSPLAEWHRPATWADAWSVPEPGHDGRPRWFVRLWRGRRVVGCCERVEAAAGADAVAVIRVLGPADWCADCMGEPSAAVFDVRPDLLDLACLSPRELEVLHPLARGRTTQDVGRNLHRSPKTVERHAEALLRKLRLPRRFDLAVFAAERGLTRFTPDEWSRIVAGMAERLTGAA